MSKSAKASFALGIIILVIGSLFFLQYRESRTTSSSIEHWLTSSKKNGVASPPEAEMRPARHLEASLGKSNPFESGYRWNPANPGIAESKEDATWLDKHGYPGPDVEQHLMSLSVDALKALVGEGNKPALAIYAFKQAQAGVQRADTQEMLLKSAASGSVYALKMGGDIYTVVDGYRDPVMASVFYGLQARSGDQAGLVQGYVVGRSLTIDQRLQVDMLRELMWRSMKNTQNGLGGGVSDFSPRPGYIDFLEHGLNQGNSIHNHGGN